MSEMTLKQARELAGLSPAQLEKLAGVIRNTVYDLEAGRNRRPSHETVTRLVRALRRSGLTGVTAEQIFPIDDPDANPSDAGNDGPGEPQRESSRERRRA